MQKRVHKIRKLLCVAAFVWGLVSCGETQASPINMQMKLGYGTAAYYTSYLTPSHSLQSGLSAQIPFKKEWKFTASIGASLSRDSNKLYAFTPNSPSIGASYAPSFLKFKYASIGLSSGLTLKLDPSSLARSNYADISLSASTGFKWAKFSVPLSLSGAKSFHLSLIHI